VRTDDKEILARLDIATEAKALGVRYSASEPNASGWQECYAINREENKPSAAIAVASTNGARGRYRDLGSADRSISLFGLAAKLAPAQFPTWREARAHYAQKVGFAPRGSKRKKVAAADDAKPPTSPAGKQLAAPRDLLKKVGRPSNGGPNDQLAKIYTNLWVEKKAGVDGDAALSAAAFGCEWPAKSGVSCIGFPGHRSAFDAEPWAVLLFRIDGENFAAFKSLPERRHHLVRGSTDSLIIAGGWERLAKADVVWKFEGPTDLLAWASYLPPEHVGITNVCGAGSWPSELSTPLSGKTVHVVGDAVKAGEVGARNVVAEVFAAAKTVKHVRLPYEIVDSHGKDARDYRNEGHTIADLLALAESAPVETAETAGKPRAKGSANSTGRIEIELSTDEESMADATVAALARLKRDEKGIYQRGGILVRIVECAPKRKGIKRPHGAPTITELPLASLREKIATATQFYKVDSQGTRTDISPPGNIVKAVESRGNWPGIPTIEAVVEAPILRADGSILETPGYDEATGVYFYKGDGIFPVVPEQPTRDVALAALRKLLDVIADFPFVAETHRAAAVAAILTPFGRFAYDGCTPFALYEANTPGAGKGLLSEVSATIWSKTGIPRMAMPQSDQEFAKKITSLLIAGDLLINWDNIRGPLGGPALEAVLTSRVWKDRILGASKMTTNMPVSLMHSGTGNNCILVGDMPRRVLNIRMEVDQENAEERSGFRHPDLLGYVREHHGELAVAAFTILRAYVGAGLPSQELPSWGTFDEWSDLIRSAVVWVGMDDPAKTRIELRDRADTEAAALLAGWEELDLGNRGLTVVEAMALVDGYPDKYAAAREAMAELFNHTKSKPASTRSIGKRLSGFRRRVANGRRFDYREDRKGTKRWFVDVAAGFAGFAGFSHNPPNAANEIKSAIGTDTDRTKTNPANPANPATSESAELCEHESHERLTFDGYIRTECQKCGRTLADDRKAAAVGA
jgi:hypothetical protein